MTWLAENWIWVLFGVAFIAMHLFGHGGHGDHGSHGNGLRGPSDAPTRRTGGSRPTPPADTAGSQRH